ncbi:hypothetical protein ACLK1S_26805 [Escherichia coli]
MLGRRWNALAAAQQLAAAGAQHMVIGRALFSSSDYRATSLNSPPC